MVFDDPPQNLLYAEVPICDIIDCVPLKFKDAPGVISEEAFNEKMLMCAGEPMNKADHGDSGGPLIVRDGDKNPYQIGVVSFGATFYDSCTFIISISFIKHLFAAVYARTSYYCGWIQMVTKNEVKCVELPPKKSGLVPLPKRGECTLGYKPTEPPVDPEPQPYVDPDSTSEAYVDPDSTPGSSAMMVQGCLYLWMMAVFMMML